MRVANDKPTERETAVLLSDSDIAMIERGLTTSGFDDDVTLWNQFNDLRNYLDIPQLNSKDQNARDYGEDCDG